ncbi:SLC13 family permease [Neptunicella marina]|uniref:DASS family sodium-coupled anion symporter n=1 Tax=Neptunicella marina TaxID=2125989 RepID=A0A8J6IPQ7_9ALTE|nr:DASS family sodium-coupled anion symporter [Neptunicella marina]MBC3765580.1 DASS family sodium-coupled anion symporter [Neptunicella marina]
MQQNTNYIEDATRARYQDVGLLLGPLVFALFMFFDGSQSIMPQEAWRVAAVGLWMAVWWATEAIPVPVTAFIPLVAFDILKVASFKEAAMPFSNPIIFLFLGAFLLAIAVEKCNLHKRIALAILGVTGTQSTRLIGGFMLVGAFLSMWMSNTSTTLMLMPICISVVKVITDNSTSATDRQKTHFQIAMLLGLAYSTTIGGLSTLIGTPPNALLAAFLAENYHMQIDFISWMKVGVPISLIMLPLAWLLLTRVLFKVDIKVDDSVSEHFAQLRKELGVMSSAEKRVGIIFLVVISLWILRRPLTEWIGITGVTDAGIAMLAALMLFLVPKGGNSQCRLLNWHDASMVPWGVLILFGGGLSLASAVSSSGLAMFLGESLQPLTIFGIAVLIIAATGLVIFLTELTSNLATAATLLPVVAAIAMQSDLSPLLLTVPVTLAASCAFMLPVATPPNAIVFASGYLTIPQMVRSGVMLNIIGMILLSLVAVWWAPYILL